MLNEPLLTPNNHSMGYSNDYNPLNPTAELTMTEENQQGPVFGTMPGILPPSPVHHMPMPQN